MDLLERLVSGGDHRQVLDPETGLSRYRVSAGPREVAALGSCTASSPSPIGIQGAQSVLDKDTAELCASIRASLGALFELPEGGAVVLSPSGTDVIYVLSALLLPSAVHHIVVGSAELGGGTLAASRGCSFSPISPHGSGPDRLAGLADRCTATPIELRDAQGHARPMEQLDSEARAAVLAALDRGEAPVLTVVPHSKTGLCAPSEALLDWALQTDGVTVLIDAAQGRVEPTDLSPLLERGAVVLVTGSKFWGGPAFSGALLLPPALAADPGPLPSSLAHWVAAANLPESWVGARAGLPADNPGMALRWAAALAEIEHTLALGPERRLAVHQAFALAVERSPLPAVHGTPRSHRWMTGVSRLPSIHCFQISAPTQAEARRVHARIDDLGWHLGQPVALGPSNTQWSLRAALGAPLLRDRAQDSDHGLAWFQQAFQQISEILSP